MTAVMEEAAAVTAASRCCCAAEAAAALALLCLAALLLLALVAHMTASGETQLWLGKQEPQFLDPVTGARRLFPTRHDPATLALSVIVPAYNEEERMPAMLDEAMKYLEDRKKRDGKFSYELIVVDDGSKDKTTEVALGYVKRFGAERVRVLTLQRNRGKGGAVKRGMFCARGESLLMADADGATKFPDLEKLEAAQKEILGREPGLLAISCGSRAHLEQDSIAQRSYFRTLLMYGFHFLVWLLCVRGVRDTQCGFKLLSRAAALRTFSSLHVERWAFDVELLYIAQCLSIPVAEVAVRWTEIEGSKLTPFWSWVQMGRDLLFIRLRYLTGAWRLEPVDKQE